MKKLLFINEDRIKTTVHIMDLDEGVYSKPMIIKGDISHQIAELAIIIATEKAEKIIFDKSGYGQVLYNTFISMIQHLTYRSSFAVDIFGNISHYEN